jgi:hypothetical protein
LWPESPSWISYQLYGLAVASDQALVGLAPADDPREPDIVCHLGHLPAGFDSSQLPERKPVFSSRIVDPQGTPILQVWRHGPGETFCFRYCEGVTFLIEQGRIWAEWVEGVTPDFVTAALLSQVLAFVLHLRGCVCLHASSVAIEGRAVLFAGVPGRGKSSTAAAFAERGCPVLADDVSVLRPVPGRGLLALPGPARVCLWPDAAAFLYGAEAAESLPEFVPWEHKRLVRLDARPAMRSRVPVPLGGIYLLAPRTGDRSAPRIEPLEKAGGLVELLTSGFVSSTLDSQHRKREFLLQAEVARTALVRRLVPSSDPSRLDRLCELVVNDVRAASLSPAGRLH